MYHQFPYVLFAPQEDKVFTTHRYVRFVVYQTFLVEINRFIVFSGTGGKFRHLFTNSGKGIKTLFDQDHVEIF